jgi:hypothetical protein
LQKIRRKGLSDRKRKTMLAVSVYMYVVSATHWALVVALSIRGLKIGEILMTPIEMLVVVYLPTINVRHRCLTT